MVIGKIDGPDASASADIKYMLYIISNGRKIELVIECHEKYMVLQIKAVDFPFIVGKEVCSVFVCYLVVSNVLMYYQTNAYHDTFARAPFDNRRC